MGTLSSDLEPTTFKYVLVLDTDLSRQVTRTLLEMGYDVLVGWDLDRLDAYEIPRGSVLTATCLYLGHTGNELTGTSANVSCELVDVATGTKVYSGTGKYMGVDVNADINGAVDRALENFPAKDGRGSITQGIPFQKRALTDRSPDRSESPSRSTGSAFFVTSDGIALTNAHVIRGCYEITAPQFAGSRVTVVRIDEQNDLAVVRTVGRKTTPLAFRVQGPVRLGEEVVVVGYPLMGLLTTEPQLTTGNVSALSGIRNDTRFLQITAPVQPGSSGGPVMDGRGVVLGVVVAKLDALRVAALAGDIPQNVNFAIRGSVAAAFLDAAGIGYQTSATGGRVAPEDIGERSRGSVFALECHMQ